MSKTKVLTYLLWLANFLIFLRLVQFQVIEHKELREKALYNYLRTYKIPAPRGDILDRNGTVIAHWKPSFRVLVIPKFLDERDITKLKELFGPVDTILDTVKNKGGFVQIRRGVTFEEVVKILEKNPEVKSLIIDAEPQRVYSEKAKYLAHLLGYVGEASKDEVEKFHLDPGDFVGKMGIERSYDSLIRGEDGYKFVAFDSKGHVVDNNPLPPVEPKPGKDLQLFVDLRLQEFTDSLFQNYPRGAAFAYNIKTGEVILFYSKPYFDPQNVLQEWAFYLNHKDKPLLNRCIQGLYPPGSTFKLVTTLVGLSSGVLTKEKRIFCSGGFTFGKRTWLCWRTEGHGLLDLEDAIAQSCNVYFNTIGALIGTQEFMKILDKFNLPKKTNLNIPGEYSVVIPETELLRKYTLYPSSAVNWAIGQGEIQVTPVWMALITGIIAGEGKAPYPRLTREEPLRYAKLDLPHEFFTIVKEGMKKVVEDPRGTAGYLYDPVLKVAGKTGTAQNPHGKEHSWFTCFFPHDDPTFVVTVIVENAGHGSEAAAPIAFQVARRIINEIH